MKKKVSLSSGCEPDIQSLAKELARLRDRRDLYVLNHDYVGVARMNAKIAEFDKRLEYLEKVSQRTLADILEGQPQDVKDRFRRNCTLIMVLADLLDSAASEVENAMAAFGPKHLNVMPVVKAIRKNVTAFGRLLDAKTGDEFAARFGNFTELCYHILINRTMAFIEKEDKEEKEKEKERSGK